MDVTLTITMGKYSGTCKIDGFAPEWNTSNKNYYQPVTIKVPRETYEKLQRLDHKYTKYYYDAINLGEELFEAAASKDKEENWRYRDCVNFNFDKYISQEPRKKEYDELWSKVYEIERKMRAIVQLDDI